MEKVLDFPRNSSNSCGLSRVGVRVTGWLRMAVCPRERPLSCPAPFLASCSSVRSQGEIRVGVLSCLPRWTLGLEAFAFQEKEDLEDGHTVAQDDLRVSAYLCQL